MRDKDIRRIRDLTIEGGLTVPPLSAEQSSRFAAVIANTPKAPGVLDLPGRVGDIAHRPRQENRTDSASNSLPDLEKRSMDVTRPRQELRKLNVPIIQVREQSLRLATSLQGSRPAMRGITGAAIPSLPLATEGAMLGRRRSSGEESERPTQKNGTPPLDPRVRRERYSALKKE